MIALAASEQQLIQQLLETLQALPSVHADLARREPAGQAHDRGYDAGPAVFAGVAGLALGAALADSHRYDGPPPPPYYGGPYYGRPYYGHRYATCYARRTVWDPYIGHYVVLTEPYAC